MWVPLAVLAAFALAIGYVLERTHIFHDLLSYTPMLATAGMRATPQPGVFHQDIAVASTVLVMTGLAVASYLYLGDRREVDFLARLFDSAWLAKVYRISSDKFFVDEIYAALVVLPLRGLAWLSYQFDRWIIDGLVNLVGWIPRSAGALLRGLQMGLVPFYGLAMVLGMLTLLIAKVVWGWQ
jgi:NADH-quinone oxidoreductase subunit L